MTNAQTYQLFLTTIYKNQINKNLKKIRIRFYNISSSQSLFYKEK